MFRGLETETSIEENLFYFNQILIPSKTIVRVVGKQPIAEPSNHRKMALRGLCFEFRCPSGAKIDASKYPSDGHLGLFNFYSLLENKSFDSFEYVHWDSKNDFLIFNIIFLSYC